MAGKVLLCVCGHPLANHFIGGSGKPTGGCRFCSCEVARFADAKRAHSNPVKEN